MISILSINVITAITDALRSLMLSLCEIIYKLIEYCYDIFSLMTQLGRILSEGSVGEFYQRIGLILGFIMIFRISFSMIQFIVDPDKTSDDKKGYGAILKKALIVIILLGSVRYIFNIAYDLQTTLVTSHVIPRVILGGEIDYNNESEGTAFANIIFDTMFYSFLSDVNDKPNMTAPQKHEHSVSIAGINVDNMSEKLHRIINNKEDNDEENGDYIYDFQGNGIIPVITGLIVLWMIITYTIQLGVRSFQLAYLELIAPIPILFYLDPEKEELLKKWTNQCVTTYLDVFIRIAILNFTVYLMEIVRDFNTGIFSTGSTLTDAYITAVMIIALMSFAKKLPNLIQEVLPTSSGAAGMDFGLGASGEMKKAFGFGKKAALFGSGAILGAAGGAAAGVIHGYGVKGKIGGLFGGAFRGAAGGMKTKGNLFSNVGKGIGNQRAAAQRFYERNTDGSKFWGRTSIGAGDAARTKAAFDEELAFYDSYAANGKIIDDEIEKDARMQAMQAQKKALLDSGTASASDIKNIDDKIKVMKNTILQNAMANKDNDTINSALANAQSMQKTAKEKGYAGLSGSSDISNYADNFFDSVKEVKNEAGEIRNISGSRNESYKQAEANAKYNKNK